MKESLVTYLKNHAPNDAFEESDPVKASTDLFPQTTYTDAEKAELSQWLITASHLGAAVCKCYVLIARAMADSTLSGRRCR